MRRARQLELPTWGGRRDGAGRKPKGPKALVSHKARPRFEKPRPVHVTLKTKHGVWNLRSKRAFTRLRDCFGKARGKHGLRLIEFSVQGNHLHLIVEADSSEALSRGMQGLSIRIARALNDMMDGRHGRVFADHFHACVLPSPTELARAIAYVLGNHTHHFGERGTDPFSSRALDGEARRIVLAVPLGWLLRNRSRQRNAPQGASSAFENPQRSLV